MPVRTPVDTMALKCANPIAEVAARYTHLRRSGRALVGRCPLHADGNRPNFYVYEHSASFYCYSCSLGGDVIRLVEMVERVDFRTALAHLGAPGHSTHSQRQRSASQVPAVRSRRSHSPDERAVLA